MTHSIFPCAFSKDRILKSVDKLVQKEKMSAESAEGALGSIEFTTDIGALKDVDFVVEAVVENIDLKRDLYTKLGELCKPETIFASNTSSLSIGGTQLFNTSADYTQMTIIFGILFANLVSVALILMYDISTMMCIEMAGFSKRSDRFLGVHFFNPVQVRLDGSILQLYRICCDDRTTTATILARN